MVDVYGRAVVGNKEGFNRVNCAAEGRENGRELMKGGK